MWQTSAKYAGKKKFVNNFEIRSVWAIYIESAKVWECITRELNIQLLQFQAANLLNKINILIFHDSPTVLSL